MKSDHLGINRAATPSGTGCVDCLASNGWWLHLRRCAQCGHIGCCDSSPSQHATEQFPTTGHPVAARFEPGETWFWSYETQEMIGGPKLAPPRWHPADQPAPGPLGKVPKDWQSRLH
jgi:Zn-finger in ubiquitin-hydrolases and other protein